MLSLVSYPFKLFRQKVYKHEKDQRSSRRPVPLFLSSESDASVVPPRPSPRRSTLPVESIKEDDEESNLKPSRTRQASVSNPPKSFPSSGRVRAVSTSSVTPRILMKLSRNASPPVSMPFNVPSPAKISSHHNRIVQSQGQDQLPPGTRVVQQNREFLDLDDVMGDSDEDSIAPPPPPVKQIGIVKSPSRPRQHAVSASTRDLMDFLAQGPPDTGSRDASDSFSEGVQAGESGKSKGSRRLQKMISKLSLGGGDKVRGSHDELSTTKTVQNASRPHLDPKSPTTNLSSLANRPIPPRPPPPVLPPSPSLDSFEERNYISSPSRSASVAQKKQDFSEGHHNEPSPSVNSPATPSHRDRGEQPSPNWRPAIPPGTNGHDKHVTLEESLQHTTLPTVAKGNVSAFHSPDNGSQNRTSRLSSPTKLQVRKPPPVYNPTPTDPHVCYDDVRDIHHLLSSATSADECRLIFDMFLAKSGINVEHAKQGGTHSLPQRSAPTELLGLADASVEHSLVELLLGGTDYASEFREHKQQTKNEELKAQAVPSSRINHGDPTVNEDLSLPKTAVHSSERGVILPRRPPPV